MKIGTNTQANLVSKYDSHLESEKFWASIQAFLNYYVLAIDDN